MCDLYSIWYIVVVTTCATNVYKQTNSSRFHRARQRLTDTLVPFVCPGKLSIWLVIQCVHRTRQKWKLFSLVRCYRIESIYCCSRMASSGIHTIDTMDNGLTYRAVYSCVSRDDSALCHKVSMLVRSAQWCSSILKCLRRLWLRLAQKMKMKCGSYRRRSFYGRPHCLNELDTR